MVTRRLLLIFTIFFALSSLGFSSDEKTYTGSVLEISKEDIVLDLPMDYRVSVGFKCEPKVCELTEGINVGDEVLVKFGAIERTNQLLSVRKCNKLDHECSKARKNLVKKRQEREEALEKSQKEMQACQDAMNKQLKNDSRYISNSWFKSIFMDQEKITDKYNTLVISKKHNTCLTEIVSAHQDAVFDSCTAFDCGNNVGGGCAHIAGYSLSTAVFAAAIDKCSN